MFSGGFANNMASAKRFHAVHDMFCVRFLDWGVLSETDKKGVYAVGRPVNLENSQVVSWLIESLLRSHPDGQASIKRLMESPSLFPFCLKPISLHHILRDSTRLEIVRHGFDEEFVLLKK